MYGSIKFAELVIRRKQKFKTNHTSRCLSDGFLSGFLSSVVSEIEVGLKNDDFSLTSSSSLDYNSEDR
jgi:hypothetical protein